MQTKFIEMERGSNIFESLARVYVNPVNCLGISGKGLAKEYKTRYPEIVKLYEDHCKTKGMEPGTIFTVDTRLMAKMSYIVFLATKDNWRNPSKIEYVRDGLIELRQFMEKKKEYSVAIPALGAGLGQLTWNEVRREIYEQFEGFDGTIEIYPPFL